MKQRLLQTIILLLFLSGLNGCARLALTSMMEPTIANLQRQTDLDLVCEGTSSFLLMLDSLLESNPGDKKLLMSATQAFSAYAAALDVCGKPERAAAVSIKSRRYGLALLAQNKSLQTIATMDPAALQTALADVGGGDTAPLFWAGNGWATWIRYQEGSAEALADLVRVEQIMQRVVALDESFHHGGAHLFLGAYYGAKPPMLGGKPEESRGHFERALELNKREFLPTQVAFAQIYARMMYDRELYEALLREVIDFPADRRPDIALANQAAKRRAKELLGEIDQYF